MSRCYEYSGRLLLKKAGPNHEAAQKILHLDDYSLTEAEAEGGSKDDVVMSWGREHVSLSGGASAEDCHDEMSRDLAKALGYDVKGRFETSWWYMEREADAVCGGFEGEDDG